MSQRRNKFRIPLKPCLTTPSTKGSPELLRLSLDSYTQVHTGNNNSALENGLESNCPDLLDGILSQPQPSDSETPVGDKLIGKSHNVSSLPKTHSRKRDYYKVILGVNCGKKRKNKRESKKGEQSENYNTSVLKRDIHKQKQKNLKAKNTIDAVKHKYNSINCHDATAEKERGKIVRDRNESGARKLQFNTENKRVSADNYGGTVRKMEKYISDTIIENSENKIADTANNRDGVDLNKEMVYEYVSPNPDQDLNGCVYGVKERIRDDILRTIRQQYAEILVLRQRMKKLCIPTNSKRKFVRGEIEP